MYKQNDEIYYHPNLTEIKEKMMKKRISFQKWSFHLFRNLPIVHKIVGIVEAKRSFIAKFVHKFSQISAINDFHFHICFFFFKVGSQRSSIPIMRCLIFEALLNSLCVSHTADMCQFKTNM